MASQKTRPATPDAGSALAGRSAWQEKLAVLAHQSREARANLVEHVARRRAFEHLQDEFGLRPEQCPKVLARAAESYVNGEFFLTNLSLFFEVTPELALTIYHLRQEWITQYELNTVPELLLLDQAMLAYFHTIRLNKEVANMLALFENNLIFADPPHVKIKKENGLSNAFNGFVAEDAIKRLQERLMPLMERFNVMFLRNLRAMRELKGLALNVNIAQAGQVNVGQQQVNMADGAGRR